MAKVFLIALLVAFPAMSTDMYLPALPTIQRQWGVSMTGVNLSLVAFFVAYSIMILVFGPISDRLGRKPVLKAGLSLFIAGSLACGAAQGIAWLTAARIVQGLGAASATTLAMAITKDLWTGSQRQRVLGYVGVIFALCPMIAPSLGGWTLALGPWRLIFLIQSLMAVVALVGVSLLKEPLKEKSSGGLFSVAGSYLSLLGNKDFMILTGSFAVMMLPLFTFIGGAAEIYINEFGVSEQAFGLHFGLNATGLMLGSIICARLSGRVSTSRILAFSLGGMLMSTLVLSLNGARLPFILTGIMFLNSLCMGINRPISNHMILDTVDREAGAASSLMMFSFAIIGAGAMLFISFDWESKIAVLAWLMGAGSLVPALALTLRSRVRARSR